MQGRPLWAVGLASSRMNRWVEYKEIWSMVGDEAEGGGRTKKPHDTRKPNKHSQSVSSKSKKSLNIETETRSKITAK